MRVRIKKWGNSAAIRIPAAVMQAAKVSLDMSVDIREENGCIIIEPHRSQEFDLNDLLTQVTDQNFHEAVQLVGPSGKEAL